MKNENAYTTIRLRRKTTVELLQYVGRNKDVFGPGRGFWETLGALFIHVIPSYALIAMLVLAWRREWIGTVLFTAAGIFFAVIVCAGWLGKAAFAAPSFLMAALFLANWVKRAELRRLNERRT